MKDSYNKKLVCEANKKEFDQEASNYDNDENRAYSKHQHKFFSDKINDALRLVKKKEELKILDIGCGTGVSTIHLLKKIKNSQFKLFCLDISKKMLEVLKSKLNKEQLKKTKFICDDATNYLNHQKESFDLILIFGTLHHIYDYLALFELCCKRLSNKGVILIVGEPLSKEKYNYYIDQTLRLWDRAIFEQEGYKRILYFIYAPFNFFSPIINNKYIRKLKFKILRKEFIEKQEELIEYWGYERGLDIEKMKEIMSINKIKIINLDSTASLVTEFLWKIEKKLKIMQSFYLIGIKKEK